MALVLGLGIYAAKGLAFLIEFTGFLIRSPGLLQRDFTAFYFLANAFRKGLDPNMPLPELGAALGMPGLTLFPHPTPHPPTAGILLLPLTLMNVTTAAVFWLFFSFAALVFATALLGRLIGIPKPGWLALPLALSLLAWQPINDDLSWGNINVLILLLLTATLFLLRANQPWIAGGALGLALLIKPIAWPILLVLLLRRQWAVSAGCALAGSVVGAVTLAVIGPAAVVRYFTESLPLAARYYQRDFLNFSLSTLGARLFEGVDFPPQNPHLHFTPLAYIPPAGSLLSIALIILAIAGGVLLTRGRSLECAIAIMTCVSIAGSPTTWTHYFTLTLLPITVLLASLRLQCWPSVLTRRSVGFVTLLALPIDLWLGLILRVAPTAQAQDGSWTFGPAVLCLMPTYFLLALAVFTSMAARSNNRVPAANEEKTAGALPSVRLTFASS
jgi:hypothetical protein